MVNPEYMAVFNERSKLIFQSFTRLVLYFMTPAYYFIWTAYVLPEVTKYFKLSFPTIAVLFCIQTFLFFNAFLNMLLNIPPKGVLPLSKLAADAQVKPQQKDDLDITDKEVSEQKCQVLQPRPRVRRHAILFITYVALSSLNGAIWSGIYLLSKFGRDQLLLEVIDYVVSLSIMQHINKCVPFFIFSVMGVFFVTPVAIIHNLNILRGYIPRIGMTKPAGFSNWRSNVVKVFGKRWRSALVWPFTDSPIPD